jgi:predicted RNA-binding Zn-ribbon protein involved in translation (DUF1610 family)
MTAAYRVFVAERGDLDSVTFVCPECQTAVKIKIETARVPEGCASCGAGLDENSQAALAALARFHRTAHAAEEKAGKSLFRFEIRERENA